MSAVGDELLLGPVDLVGNLGQVGAAAVAFTDVDAVTMEFELVEALDATHGREDGDLDVEVVELITGDGREKPRKRPCLWRETKAPQGRFSEE